jgi:hypothetical protein
VERAPRNAILIISCWSLPVLFASLADSSLIGACMCLKQPMETCPTLPHSEDHRDRLGVSIASEERIGNDANVCDKSRGHWTVIFVCASVLTLYYGQQHSSMLLHEQQRDCVMCVLHDTYAHLATAVRLLSARVGLTRFVTSAVEPMRNLIRHQLVS